LTEIFPTTRQKTLAGFLLVEASKPFPTLNQTGGGCRACDSPGALFCARPPQTQPLKRREEPVAPTALKRGPCHQFALSSMSKFGVQRSLFDVSFRTPPIPIRKP
jgi:hypothetical protein